MIFSNADIEVIKQGGIAVIPTDTIYGLVASVRQLEAIERVYVVKGRDFDKRCIILIADPDEMLDFGVDSKDIAAAKSYWGSERPTSIDVPVADGRGEALLRGFSSLAFRLVKQKNLVALIHETGPLIAPSANPQGLPPATTIKEARAYFGGSVDIYVDGGEMHSPPSRLISIVDETVTVVRE